MHGLLPTMNVFTRTASLSSVFCSLRVINLGALNWRCCWAWRTLLLTGLLGVMSRSVMGGCDVIKGKLEKGECIYVQQEYSPRRIWAYLSISMLYWAERLSNLPSRTVPLTESRSRWLACDNLLITCQCGRSDTDWMDYINTGEGRSETDVLCPVERRLPGSQNHSPVDKHHFSSSRHGDRVRTRADAGWASALSVGTACFCNLMGEIEQWKWLI